MMAKMTERMMVMWMLKLKLVVLVVMMVVVVVIDKVLSDDALVDQHEIFRFRFSVVHLVEELVVNIVIALLLFTGVE